MVVHANNEYACHWKYFKGYVTLLAMIIWLVAEYLSDECINGGNEIDDAIYFGVEFARAGIDILSLSRGGKFEDARQPKIGKVA